VNIKTELLEMQNGVKCYPYSLALITGS